MEYLVKRLENIVPDKGNCGERKKIITSDECDSIGVSHLMIRDARVHSHRYTYEIYYVLNGSGIIEIDGETIPVTKNTAVLIPPAKKHRAISTENLEVLVIMSPAAAEGKDIVYWE